MKPVTIERIVLIFQHAADVVKSTYSKFPTFEWSTNSQCTSSVYFQNCIISKKNFNMLVYGNALNMFVYFGKRVLLKKCVLLVIFQLLFVLFKRGVAV